MRLQLDPPKYPRYAGHEEGWHGEEAERYPAEGAAASAHTAGAAGFADQAAGPEVAGAAPPPARFNASGFTTFERPSNPRGRIPIVTAEQWRELMDGALSSPSGLEEALPGEGDGTPQSQTLP